MFLGGQTWDLTALSSASSETWAVLSPVPSIGRIPEQGSVRGREHYIHVYMHVSIYIYIYTYIYTHIYIGIT